MGKRSKRYEEAEDNVQAPDVGGTVKEEQYDDDVNDENVRDRHNRRHRDRHHGSRKHKRVRIMDQSGQTDEDRRVLRHKQRELARNIVESDEIENAGSDAFEKIRGKNNDLFENVRYTREAVLDGDNLDLICNKAARQVDKLVQVARYDPGRLIQKLRQACTTRTPGGTHFDWHGLGVAVGPCFKSLPSRCAFLAGPIDAVYAPKERKKPVRRSKAAEEEDEAEEEKVEEVEQTSKDKDADKLSAVERHIKIISKTLKKRCRKELEERSASVESKLSSDDLDDKQKKRLKKQLHRKGTDVDAVKMLFNPQSFTQSVENIFHFSFLVKAGQAGIGVRTEEDAETLGGAGPGPVLREIPENLDSIHTPRQAIVSLNMRDWRDMCQAFQVEKSDIPHRTGSKHTRPNAGRS